MSTRDSKGRPKDPRKLVRKPGRSGTSLADRFFEQAKASIVERKGEEWVREHQGLLEAQEQYIRDTFF